MEIRIRNLSAALLAALLLYVAGCAVNPVTGKNELSILPEAQEIALGAKQFAPTQQSQGGQYRVDPGLSRYVNEVGQRLASKSDRPLPYEFVVLNNSVPNAWALPGGKIAVNRGLLLELGSEAELAAVLGHEIVHAAAKHGARAYQRGMLLQGAMVATSLYAGGRDHADYIIQGAAIGAQLVSQRYGRDAERESDYYGMQYMARAGYDPAAAVSLQETFLRLSEGKEANWLEGLFSSHPPSGERVEANRRTAEEMGATGEWGKERYERELAYLRKSKPAYDAMDEARKKVAENDPEMAMSMLDRAISIEPREAIFRGMKGDVLLQQKRYRNAIASFDKAAKLDDSYYQYYLGRGLARSKLGDQDRAKLDLEHSYQLLPTAMAASELGKLALAGGNRAVAKNYFQSAAGAGGVLGQEASLAFVKLDLPDNPGNYLRSGYSYTDEGRLLVTVANTSGLGVKDVEVEIRAVKGDRQLTRTHRVASLPANRQVQIETPWRSSEENPLKKLQIVIRRVAL